MHPRSTDSECLDFPRGVASWGVLALTPMGDKWERCQQALNKAASNSTWAETPHRRRGREDRGDRASALRAARKVPSPCDHVGCVFCRDSDRRRGQSPPKGGRAETRVQCDHEDRAAETTPPPDHAAQPPAGSACATRRLLHFKPLSRLPSARCPWVWVPHRSSG